MPLEIRELVIRVNVTAEMPGQENSVAKTIENMKEKMVAECVETVLKTIERAFE